MPYISEETWSRLVVGKIPRNTIPREPLGADEVTRLNTILQNVEDKYRMMDDNIANLIAAWKNVVREVLAETHKAKERNLGIPYYPEDGTFTITEIEPGIFSASLATPYYTWDFTVTAGWNDLYGSAADPIEGSTAPDGKKQFLILGILVESGPPPEAFTMGVGDVVYDKPFQPLLVSNPEKPWTLVIFPNPVYIHFKGKFYLRALFRRSASGVYRPLGFQSVDSELLTESNIYA